MNSFRLGSKINKIGIVGAGMSGMQAAFYLKQKGFTIKIFEKESNIGGVWRSNYYALRTQTPASLMKIPTFSFPDHLKNEEVLCRKKYFEYLETVSQKMNICSEISFNSEVINIDYKNMNPERDPLLITYNSKEGTKTEEFDAVILCQGRFHKLRPLSYKNENLFQGKIYHSSTLVDKEFVKDKKAVIVGYGKSACDIAGDVAETAAETSILFREISWSIPYFINKKWRFDKLLLNSRLSRYIFDSAIYETWMEQVWHRKLKFFRNFLNRTLEKIICKQYNLEKFNIKPEFSLEKQILQQGIYISAEKFFKNVNLGKIKHIKGEIQEFEKDGVILQDSKKIACDTVILAVGFDDNFYFLGDSIKKSLGVQDKITLKTLKLYKGVIDPRVPNLYFVGFKPAVTSPITYGLQAIWMVNFVSEKIKVSQQQAEKYIEKITENFENFYSRYGIDSKMIPFNSSTTNFHDEMLKDLRFLDEDQYKRMNRQMKTEDFEPFFMKSR